MSRAATKLKAVKTFQELKGVALASPGGLTPERLKRGTPPVRTEAEAKRWLDDQLTRGRTEIFSVVQMLTESLARLLLDSNPENRLVQKATVTIYSREMKDGHFDSMNGESIHISKEGLLNNGQHRLEARILAGVDLPFLFTFGLERASRRTVDQARNRSAKDFLAMKGLADGGAVASVALMLYQWRRAKKVSSHSDDRIGISQIAEYAEMHYAQIAQSVRIIPRAGIGATGGLAVLAFCHLICAEKDVEAANDFYTRLVNGNDLPRDSAILTLSVKLRRRERLTRTERVELMLRAWNGHRENRSMATIPVLRQGLPDPI